MFNGLLKHSLNRIASLKHYYEVEVEHVSKVSEKGMQENYLGTKIDVYLEGLVHRKEVDTEAFKKLEDEVLKVIEVSTVNENSVVYRFLSEEEGKKIGSTRERRRLFFQFAEMPSMHGNSALMMLVTRFEEFFSDFLCELYDAFPEKYLDSQLIKYSEIKSSDIDDIKTNLVCREVENKMRENYSEWFKIYCAHGMKTVSFETDLKVLAEIYARRNILVHNSGTVNSSYLKAVPESDKSQGDILSANEQYMKKAFETVSRIITLMLIEASKLEKEAEGEYLQDVFDVLFEMLRQEDYSICEPAYELLTEKKRLSADYVIMSKVNRWICKKAINGLASIEEEVKAFDVSALNSDFQLAKSILLEEYQEATEMLKTLLTNEEFFATYVEQWPLFVWYRETEYYAELRKELPDKFNVEYQDVVKQNEGTLQEEGLEPLACN